MKKRIPIALIALTFAALIAMAFACKEEEKTGLTPEEQQKADGRKLFITNCIACHSADPTRDGTVGPALRGTPFNVLKTKLIEGKYPEGYPGKRPISGSMPKYSFTDEQIRSMDAFLK